MITETDLSIKLLNKIEPMYKNIIIDFCNSFLSLYGNILSKEKLIDRINLLDDVYKTEVSNDETIAEHERLVIDDRTFTDNIYINKNKNFSNEQLKVSLYHELIHLISHHPYVGSEGKIFYYNGLQQISIMLDEVVTESIAVNLINFEGINLDKKIVTKKAYGIISPNEEYIHSRGTGYENIAMLGQIYIDIFGDEILNGKFNDLELFYQNNYSKEDNVISTIVEELDECFYKNTRISIYNCYSTAIEIFGKFEIEKFDKSEFNLYQYLYDSYKIIQYLPKKANDFFGNQKNQAIINYLDNKINDLDNKIIKKYIFNDENIEKNAFYNSVINTLRDNINNLTEKDFENLYFGRMPQSVHGNSHILVVSAGENKFLNLAKVNFSTLDNNEMNYLGASKFEKLSDEKYGKRLVGEKSNFNQIRVATLKTVNGYYSVLETEKGFIPLWLEPKNGPIDLYDIEYINNNALQPNNRRK